MNLSITKRIGIGALILVGTGIFIGIVSSSPNKVREPITEIQNIKGAVEEAAKISSADKKEEGVDNIKSKKLELINHHREDEPFVTTINGKITNNSDQAFNYVQVEITLLDKDGNVVGSALDNINSLSPGQSWKFRAHTTVNVFDDYEIHDVSGF